MSAVATQVAATDTITSKRSPMTRTQLRRAQRSHSKICYNEAKQKLISLLVPIPESAIDALDLERFRMKLYTPADDTYKLKISFPEQPEGDCGTHGVMCNWCGIWVPLPVVPVEPVLEASHEIEIDSDTSLMQPAAEVIDMAELFSPLLCEVVSARDGEHNRDQIKELLKQRVSAFQARLQQCCAKSLPVSSWQQVDVTKHVFCIREPPAEVNRLKRYSFKRTHIGEVPETKHNRGKQHLPVSRYSTDESTGECKVQ